ncbi:hypothetical protein BH09PSE3_BH09PSE3_09400 [soil metagenome]
MALASLRGVTLIIYRTPLASRSDATARSFVARERTRQLKQALLASCPTRLPCYSSSNMTDNTLTSQIDRINLALARIEAASARPKAPAMPDGNSRYQALRNRTQAALASLESVIAQIGPNERAN